MARQWHCVYTDWLILLICSFRNSLHSLEISNEFSAFFKRALSLCEHNAKKDACCCLTNTTNYGNLLKGFFVASVHIKALLNTKTTWVAFWVRSKIELYYCGQDTMSIRNGGMYFSLFCLVFYLYDYIVMNVLMRHTSSIV